MQLRFLCTLAAAAVVTTAHAQEHSLKSLRIGQPHARATAPHQPSGAAYLTIENKGNEVDRLIAATSPVAKSVEMHSMSMEGNMMKMREIPNIELKPGATLVMKPGNGYHLMLTGLHQPLKAGDRFPLTLTFEKAGKTEVSVLVQDKVSGGGHGGHQSH